MLPICAVTGCPEPDLVWIGTALHPDVFDHIALPVADLSRSEAWYTTVLDAIGLVPIEKGPGFVKYGVGPMPYLTLRESAASPAPSHIAFKAAQRADVHAFFAAVERAGGRDNGAPGLRPQYHANYYSAFALDPDGHNIEVVKHDPE